MKKKVVAAAVMMAAVMAAAGCGNGSTGSTTAADTTAADTAADTEAAEEESSEETDGQEAEAAADGTFVVGFDADLPPMGFKAEDGSYTGFDLDLAKEVANRLGLEFVAQPILWDAKDMELDNGTIDCVWNGFTITGREDQYTWTDPYMDNAQVFVVMADSGISSLEDLAGKVVEVQVDSAAETALNEMTDLKASLGSVETTPNYNQAIMDLEMGAVDAVGMDSVVANYLLTQRGTDAVILDDALSSEEYAVGFKLGNTELRDQVQAALEEMAADGTMAEISEEWFGSDITTIGK
ncbi:ABC transporter substrate-binding protein [Lachnoclostridium sp. An14]|uniref:amino acid ABC transporter substrate-binding protein n=1 Tax=Lachnoclostridium sp. An14 TaxID=1965562 RepID=UPI000B3727E1|nr:amino acid ABC transporter substrate-binding protein [Lachnoclostridium sp. An14]OUQ17376.1 ABC transporter substrate-binding protein [Lachnoclostridium sp. An14]